MLQRMRGGLAWAIIPALFAMAAPAARAADAPLLAAIFGDHVVLQRDRPIEVWGRAQPGEEVTVTLSGATQRAVANASGAWHLALPALPAGGPHTLIARTKDRQQNVTDVLVGDVWLCSGQSNMEWAVRNTLNAGNEVAHSANDKIRQVTIPRLASIAPLADFAAPLEWKVAGPTTTQDFSAVCYYYARELQKSVSVPQGMVVSSWGGTRIETWMSRDTLRRLGGNDAGLDLLGEYGAEKSVAMWHWGQNFQDWWRGQAATRGKQPWVATRGDAADWHPAPRELTHWEDWGESALAEYDGMVWFRAHVQLTRAQARQAATLSLGELDDADIAWINGRAMGSGFGEGEHAYAVPAQLLKAGDNVIVVNVFNMWGAGGLHGPAANRALRFADGTSVALTNFEYQLPPAGLAPTPRAPWEPIAGINILYNGMIAPLGKFGLRGVAWYQGEANASLADAQRYEAQLAALFADWRQQFDAPLPWLVVQLANWGPLAKSPVDSGWARLRDAQRRAVAADGNAGLAITMDIGNRDDIHPTNKQDVGRRLARAARAVIYREKISASGAQPRAAQRGAAGVTVKLVDFDGNLLVIGAQDPSGFELCGATQDTCHFVRAQLRAGGEVLLEDASAATTTRVRFCWADSPLCNLFDSTGLPVGPFEIPIE